MKPSARRFPIYLPLLTCLLAPLATAQPGPESPQSLIAIIIDDLGNRRAEGERAILLPGDITYAILPHTTHSGDLARLAQTRDREVILHMPMENVHNRPIGDGGLTHLQNHDLFEATVEAALEDVPGATGISNHMGSYLTQRDEQMSWLMGVLKQRHLFFIDSRTTPRTLAARVARNQAVPEASRDVFLDNVVTYYEIDREFQRLLRLAKEQGSAIAIGHPHDVTLSYLEMAVPLLADQNVRLVRASLLLNRDHSPVPGTMVAQRREANSGREAAPTAGSPGAGSE